MTLLPENSFDKFIGIDWSGAYGKTNKKLKVAICEPGNELPRLIRPEMGKHWSRSKLVNWLIQEAAQKRILAGMDFGFAYPYTDNNAYFPGSANSPKTVFDLWQTLESVCKESPNFYAGSFYKHHNSSFSAYLCYQTYKGELFDNNRLRKTELASKLLGARPSCLFKMVGSDQAGSGSASGIRVLHHIASNYSGNFSIWPFDSVSNAKSVIVEIYPRLFFAIAKQNSHQYTVPGAVNSVLKYYGSKPLTDDVGNYNEDEIDAIISAAALRSIAVDVNMWQPARMDEQARQFEGWIFGCR